MAADLPSGRDVVSSLTADDLSMLHFKQSVSGEQQTTVGDGQVDWSEQLNGMRDMQFNGPALFEIAPDANVWENLRVSQAYLQERGLSV